MTTLVRFPIDNGDFVYLEVEANLVPEGLEKASRQEGSFVSTNQRFETALEQIKPATEALIGRLKSISDLPDEIEVEFGLKLSAQLGAFIATGTVDANYTVKLKWSKNNPTK